MLVIGAKGHAKEVIEILKNDHQSIYFFDNISQPPITQFLEHYKVLNSWEAVAQYFQNEKKAFCLALGGTRIKEQLANKCLELGGNLVSCFAQNAIIGSFDVNIGKGCNIMQRSFISNSVSIDMGVLVNYGASLHHDVQVGRYCEIAPGAQLLGRCTIGDYVAIGAGSIILPDIVIGDNAVIGAGAVVTQHVAPGTTVVGIPAKPKTTL